METSTLERTIRGPSPISGTAGTGLPNARSGANRRQPLPSSPSAAQTPNEALTYIDLLYKTGRMEEAAALLRQSKVFREAWLILQRSFATPSGISEGPEPTKLEEAIEPEHIPATLKPSEPADGPCPTACTPAQAHKVYQNHLNFYDQERNSAFRLSLWV